MARYRLNNIKMPINVGDEAVFSSVKEKFSGAVLKNL